MSSTAPWYGVAVCLARVSARVIRRPSGLEWSSGTDRVPHSRPLSTVPSMGSLAGQGFQSMSGANARAAPGAAIRPLPSTTPASSPTVFLDGGFLSTLLLYPPRWRGQTQPRVPRFRPKTTRGATGRTGGPSGVDLVERTYRMPTGRSLPGTEDTVCTAVGFGLLSSGTALQ